jgi:arylsulfatase A-like enzyme
MKTQEQKRPNVLLICVDHWPGSLLGCSGHTTIMTPTLDQLAANGVRFNNAYSACPMCIPARRGLMTGTTPRMHGDRIFNETLPMDPALPTLAGTFSQAGYQTYAVGKLHVFPQRDRIGFDDVILNEEGRHHLGMKADDYEMFLAREGFTGQEYVHGMPTTDYMTRTWHLPEYTHHTNWTVREMCTMIQRRDPTRPSFWYTSFNFPHPPLAPLPAYMELYRDIEIPPAYFGDWTQNFDSLPYALKWRRDKFYAQLNDPYGLRPSELDLVRRAFYAQCTHIDHQIRLLIGLLREEGLLDNTIIAFTSDHGDMLGNHGEYAKSIFYEDSAKIPFIIVPTPDYEDFGHHQVDDRLVELRDLMPTLLDMVGIDVLTTVEGIALNRGERREILYGEAYTDPRATRMIRDARYKLIYYPVGNVVHLFDLLEDPNELVNLAGKSEVREQQQQLEALLIEHLYGEDLAYIQDGKLIGLPDIEYLPGPNRGLTAQRGWRFIG